MMLRMGGGDSEYSSEGGSYDEYEEEEFDGGEEEGIDHDHLVEEGDGMDGSYYDEDAFDANNNRDVDAGEFEDDEAFARALQDAEERDVAVRLMALAGLSECECI
jgi:E3 ubiquitin-protein ligase BIG BROTHER and related proteins